MKLDSLPPAGVTIGPCPEIWFQDEHCIVVEKPADVLSVPGRGEEKQDCIWRRVQKEFPTARIAHRLDYATSGLMVLALTAEAHRNLNESFQKREIGKAYEAVVTGHIVETSGTVEAPLICDWENRPLQMVCEERGKAANTQWQNMGIEAANTRVHLIPITGRSHQLRVHMLTLGHAIVGDRFYASEEVQAQSTRLLLHAKHLVFPHPITGESIETHSPVPF